VQVENGFAIWDFRGQEQQRHLIDRFKQFAWRPRPRTLLTKEQQKAIRKNLKEYSRQFEEDDAAQESNVSAEGSGQSMNGMLGVQEFVRRWLRI
jgi:translation initiation factor 3 subunit B